MIGYWKAARAARRARREYELAVLEGLIAENRAQIARLAELDECPWCKDMETAEQQRVCADGS